MTSPAFDLVQGDRLKKLLDRLWSPSLAGIGLEPRNDNSWAEPGETNFRKIVSFCQLKGAGAVSFYGLSLRFVPTIGRNGLAYHRTQKSARIDVINVYPPTYMARRPISGKFPEISLFNPRESQQTLTECIGPLTAAAHSWFKTVHDLDSLESALRARIADNLYPNLWPRPEYPLAFIEAARGNFPEAHRLLEFPEFPELHEEFRETAFRKAHAAFPL